MIEFQNLIVISSLHGVDLKDLIIGIHRLSLKYNFLMSDNLEKDGSVSLKPSNGMYFLELNIAEFPNKFIGLGISIYPKKQEDKISLLNYANQFLKELENELKRFTN